MSRKRKEQNKGGLRAKLRRAGVFKQTYYDQKAKGKIGADFITSRSSIKFVRSLDGSDTPDL